MLIHCRYYGTVYQQEAALIKVRGKYEESRQEDVIAKGNQLKSRAKSTNYQRAKSQEPRAKSQEPKTKN
jgi:hypothetical protein